MSHAISENWKETQKEYLHKDTTIKLDELQDTLQSEVGRMYVPKKNIERENDREKYIQRTSDSEDDTPEPVPSDISPLCADKYDIGSKTRKYSDDESLRSEEEKPQVIRTALHDLWSKHLEGKPVKRSPEYFESPKVREKKKKEDKEPKPKGNLKMDVDSESVTFTLERPQVVPFVSKPPTTGSHSSWLYNTSASAIKERAPEQHIQKEEKKEVQKKEEKKLLEEPKPIETVTPRQPTAKKPVEEPIKPIQEVTTPRQPTTQPKPPSQPISQPVSQPVLQPLSLSQAISVFGAQEKSSKSSL